MDRSGQMPLTAFCIRMPGVACGAEDWAAKCCFEPNQNLRSQVKILIPDFLPIA